MDEPVNEYEGRMVAVTTLLAGLGAALGIALVASGRAKDVYPWAIGAALAGATVAAGYALGGDAPPQIIRRALQV